MKLKTGNQHPFTWHAGPYARTCIRGSFEVAEMKDLAAIKIIRENLFCPAAGDGVARINQITPARAALLRGHRPFVHATVPIVLFC